MLPTESTGPEVSPQPSLLDYLAVIKRNIWWGVCFSLLLFAGITLHLFFWVKPVYRATALIEIEAAYPVLGPTGSLIVPKVETHLQLIKNQEVLFKAMQELGLVTERINPLERERRTTDFAKPLTLSKVPDTPLIQIHYEHADPVQAARIVNTIVKVYQAKLLEDKEEKTDCRGVFIKQQLIEVTNQINALEVKLEKMKVSGQDMEKTGLLARKLAEVELSYTTQSSKFGVKHPAVSALEEEMASLKKQMEQLSPNDLIYVETLREKQVNENLYNLLNTSLKQVQIEAADKTVPARVVSWALVPGRIFKPDRKMNLIAGAFISFLIGVFIIFLRQALDLSLDTPERLEEYLKIPVLAVVPRFKRLAQPPRAVQAAVKVDAPKTVAGVANEATPQAFSQEERNLMERLRQLEVIGPEARWGTMIAVISPIKTSGKTMILSYYGCAAAQDGKKVLLADLDSRKPSLHKKFNLARKPGITEILYDGLPLDQVVHNIPQPTGVLNIITSGRTTDSPIRLVSSPRFDKFLTTIRESYDLILFDTPPVLPAVEVIILCRKIDGYIVVHKSGRLDRYLLAHFKTHFLTELRDKCWGAVLNQCRYREADYYGAYYHKYAYYQKRD